MKLDQAYDEIKGVRYTLMAAMMAIVLSLYVIVAVDIYEHMNSPQKSTPAKEILCIGVRT